MNIKSQQKGFTLIEILVATAIFAMVMIIAVATFSWAAGYNNRLKETRRVGQEVRNAMDQLTRDIRLANGKGNLTIGSTNYQIGEITLMLCSQTASTANTTCRPVQQASAARYTDLSLTTNPSGIQPVSNAILILQNDSKNPKAIFYRSIVNSGENYKLTVAINDKNDINFNALNLSTDFPVASTLVMHPVPPGNNPMSMQVWFGGYCGIKGGGRIQQPYAEVYIIGETYNFNSVQPNMRSRFHIRTMAETRDYNP